MRPCLRLLLLASLSLQLTACDRSARSSPSVAAPVAASTINVEELMLADAQVQLASGDLTAHQLTAAYLARIAAVDDGGPMLNAVIELNPDALADADRLDAERSAGNLRGPLHGIPLLLKDNIDVVGLVNSAGSLALAENRPAADAELVRRLRAAGVVILGKTNLSEWANFRSTHSISGWSSRGGQTKNPYVLDRNPCGSSSGTGTAIAASLAVIGIGTETDGSIICPSSVSGLVGVKPTVGLVSRSGIIPISVSQDTAGPMARSVADAAALLDVIAGYDANDPAMQGRAQAAVVNYTAALNIDALKGARIGVLREAMGYLPAVDANAERAYQAMRDAGAELVDVKIASWGKWDAPEFEVLLYEFKDGLNRYLATATQAPRTLADVIAWNAAHSAQAMPWFAQELFDQAQAKGALTDAAYLKARDDARRFAGAEGLLATLDGEHLDALIAPSNAPAWVTDTVLGDHYVGGGYGISAVAGTPSITVPSGDTQGLPLGVVFMGRAYDEARLIGLAYSFEQATHYRTPPTYRSTLTP